MRVMFGILFAALAGCASDAAVRCPTHTTASHEGNVLSCSRAGGELEGALLYFPDRGALEAVGWHRDGQEVGSWVSFDAAGQLLVERRFLASGRQIARHWYPDGSPMIYAEWRSERLDGWFRTWHPNGQLQSEGRYRDGKRNGIWKFWKADGSLRESVTYETGAEVDRSSHAR